MAKLSPAKIKTLHLPGRYAVDRGLYLNIAPGGSKSWVQRIQFDGKRKDVGLGSHLAVSLAEARQRADKNRVRVAEGKAPLSSKALKNGKVKVAKTASAPTFEQVARDFYEENVGRRWKHPMGATNWINRAQRYVFPEIGDTPVNEVTSLDVLKIVVPVMLEKPEVGKRLRVILNQVFGRALAYGLIQNSPAGPAINAALPQRENGVKHMKSLPYAEVGEALAKVADSGSFLSSKLAYRFMVLTGARTIEVRRATWSEMDTDAALWRIPGSKMKNGKEHTQPLSRQALKVLEAVRPLTDGADDDWVFPAQSGLSRCSGMIGINTFTTMNRDLAIDCTGHGFRSSFRVWASEQTQASWAAMELALGHGVGSSVEQAYNRSDMLSERAGLMQSWADYLDQ